ncbi:hypothetical protein ACWCQS_37670 [Streptomyces sp. NPDC002076]
MSDPCDLPCPLAGTVAQIALLGPLFTAYGFSAVGWACAGITLVAFCLSGWASRRDDERVPAREGVADKALEVKAAGHED